MQTEWGSSPTPAKLSQYRSSSHEAETIIDMPNYYYRLCTETAATYQLECVDRCIILSRDRTSLVNRIQITNSSKSSDTPITTVKLFSCTDTVRSMAIIVKIPPSRPVNQNVSGGKSQLQRHLPPETFWLTGLDGGILTIALPSGP